MSARAVGPETRSLIHCCCGLLMMSRREPDLEAFKRPPSLSGRQQAIIGPRL